MKQDLYHKRNERILPDYYYPVGGNRNILRKISNSRKLRSFTGPNGRGWTVRTPDGRIRSHLESKAVFM
jgi:hypothetical protein